MAAGEMALAGITQITGTGLFMIPYGHIEPFLFFGSIGIRTQDLVLGKSALYHLSHTPQPFLL
jgi:hypothetical protein